MSPAKQSIVHKAVIQIQGRDVPVILRAMKRKSLRLSLTEAGEVEVKMPLRCPKYELMEFLNKHTPWLEARLSQFEQSQKNRQENMLHLGKKYQFRASSQKSKEPVLIEDVCFYPSSWSEENLLKKVEGWQRSQAKIIFQQLIDKWWPHFSQGALIGNPILRVKKMRSRWGSLSSKGYINLNLRLLEFDLDIIEMVVVHELCHSHYFDHSANFYRLMAEKLPHYQEIERKLKLIEKDTLY